MKRTMENKTLMNTKIKLFETTARPVLA